MSSGAFHLDVPHICGESIPVEVAWQHWPGTYMDPPEDDVQYEHPKHCYKCGVNLELDDLFQNNIQQMDLAEDERGEYVPGDEEDYEPEDFGDEMPF